MVHTTLAGTNHENLVHPLLFPRGCEEAAVTRQPNRDSFRNWLNVDYHHRRDRLLLRQVLHHLLLHLLLLLQM